MKLRKQEKLSKEKYCENLLDLIIKFQIKKQAVKRNFKGCRK
jgi:hypothetical protein